MKINVDRKALLAAIDLARGCAAGHTPKAILQHVLLSAEDGRLDVYATNLSTWLRRSIECECIEPGKVTVDPQRVITLLRAVDDEHVMLTGDDDACRITTSSSKVKLNGHKTADYPGWLTPESETPSLTVRAGDMRKMLRVAFAMANDASRYSIAGVLLKATGNGVTACATDGRQAAMVHVNAQQSQVGADGDMQMIIHGDSLKLIKRIVSELDGDTEIRLFIESNRAMLQMADLDIWAQTIAGTFPYDALCGFRKKPGDSPTMGVDRAALVQAVRQATVAADADSVRIQLAWDTNSMTVELAESQIGDGAATCQADYSGPSFSFQINPKFLTGCVQAAFNDNVQIITAPDDQKVVIHDSDDSWSVIMKIAEKAG